MLLFCLADLHSQILAVKSDLLTGTLSSPNFGVEVKLSNRLTLEAGFSLQSLFRQAETSVGNIGLCSLNCATGCASPFGGHFFGAHLLYGVYNVGGMKLPSGGSLKEYVLQDMKGTSWGWEYHTAITFILAPRWSIETSVGVGFLHTGYERYRCLHCGEQTGGEHKNFIAPTRVAVSLVYLIN